LHRKSQHINTTIDHEVVFIINGGCCFVVDDQHYFFLENYIMSNTSTQSSITSTPVDESDRLDCIEQTFGLAFPFILEPAIYTFADRLSSGYSGGYWHYRQLSNGGFYMYPDQDEPFHVTADNGYDGNELPVCSYWIDENHSC